jgi:hypothetical protein
LSTHLSSWQQVGCKHLQEQQRQRWLWQHPQQQQQQQQQGLVGS